MRLITEMPDIDGNTVKPGDFVQLTEGKERYINASMRKGVVLKVAYMENRPFSKDEFYPVAFLTGKGHSGRIYSNGVTPREIRKVNYDVKCRKIVEAVAE